MAYGKISAKQQEILDYIKEEILKRGYPPAVREICEAVNLKSTSSVHSHLETLEKNGYIKRDPTKPRAIEICDDKRKTALALSLQNLSQPLTFPAPMTYENIGFPQLDFLSQIESKLAFPIIVKEAFGSFGQQVYMAKDHKELSELTKKLENVPFLYQQYIRESSGRDIRLQVVGDEVVAAMERTSDTDFRANVSNGGKMHVYQPDKEAVELAVKACRAVKCDFAGVDLLFGREGYLVCEVNSNAHFKNLLDCTKVNTAWYILQYIKKQGEPHHAK